MAYSANLSYPRWNCQECSQGLTLTDMHKPPACDAGIGDQLVQSLCAAMAQTILNVSSVAVFTASLVKKDFTENIKAIWKLSLALHSFNLGIVVVCSTVWLHRGVALLALPELLGELVSFSVSKWKL